MICGCTNKKKIIQAVHQDSVDSPLQIKLIKALGLQNYILDKFVFRRKQSSYTIRNVLKQNTLYLNGIFSPPLNYKTTIQILRIKGHSIPVAKLTPLNYQKPYPCIIYCHGNASDLGDSVRFISSLASKLTAEYIVFDYTGYGQSKCNQVGEEIICKDLEYVIAWSERPLEQIILWGFSLGTFPVVYNAARYNIKSIILQCPIGSVSCMFYEDYSTNIKFKDDHFANIDYITSIKSNILIMHSTMDEIIPIAQARLLYFKYVEKHTNSNIQLIQAQKIRHNGFHKYIISDIENDLQKEVFTFINNSIVTVKQRYEINSHLLQLSKLISLQQIEQEIFDEEEYEISQTENQNQRITPPKIVNINFPNWFCFKK